MAHARRKVAIICPGRGTYTKSELGYLKSHKVRERSDVRLFLEFLDTKLKSLGQPSVSDLDAAPQFSLKTHTPGEFASTLIYACSMVDFFAVNQDKFEIIAVTGNSMGWYTTLAVAGALAHDSAFTVIHTMGSMMKDGVIGGQLIYPTFDSQWHYDQGRAESLAAAVAKVTQTTGGKLYPSIEFGGYKIYGGEAAALAALMKELPPLDEGRYPMMLANHAAFHTPLLSAVAQKGQTQLGLELFQAPRVPMVDGRGKIWQPYSTDINALRQYTLGHQVDHTYDFTRAVEVTLREFAPDALVLLGPGATSGGAIGQIVVKNCWWGLRSKGDFAQRQDQSPILYAMGRPEQASLLI